MDEYTGNIRYDTFQKVTEGDTSDKWGTPPMYILWLNDQREPAMEEYRREIGPPWSDNPDYFISVYPDFFDQWLKKKYWSREELYRWEDLTLHLK